MLEYDQKQVDLLAIITQFDHSIRKESRFLRSIQKCLYIYGGVGRGKSMIMDLYFENSAIKKKQRVHFHSFMQQIHKDLHHLRSKNIEDPLPLIAKSLAKQVKLLCFDEFQVADIADAMIMERLFHAFFSIGIRVVITSNRHPKELYKGGIQREKFMEFVEFLAQQSIIFNLDGDKDYRMEKIINQNSSYFYPLGHEANRFIASWIVNMAGDISPSPVVLEAFGNRKFEIKRAFGKIAMLDFQELCEEAKGVNDYIAIAKYFEVVIVENIPIMGKEMRNEAKRFTLFIDEIYEHRKKLVISATAKPEELYKMGDGSFEFERTISRIYEICEIG